MKHSPSTSRVASGVGAAAQRDLELGDGVVEQAHLLEGQAQVVVAGRVLRVEPSETFWRKQPEDLREVLLLVTAVGSALDLEAGDRGLLLAEDERAEVHVLRRLVLLGADGLQRVLRRRVARVEVEDAREDLAALAPLLARDQVLAEREIGVHQALLVARAEGVLHPLAQEKAVAGPEGEQQRGGVDRLREALRLREIPVQPVEQGRALLRIPALHLQVAGQLEARVQVVRVLLDAPAQRLERVLLPALGFSFATGAAGSGSELGVEERQAALAGGRATGAGPRRRRRRGGRGGRAVEAVQERGREVAEGLGGERRCSAARDRPPGGRGRGRRRGRRADGPSPRQGRREPPRASRRARPAVIRGKRRRNSRRAVRASSGLPAVSIAASEARYAVRASAG